jgi:hypothetical protein
VANDSSVECNGYEVESESPSIEPVVSREEFENPSVEPVEFCSFDHDRVIIGMEDGIGINNKAGKLYSTRVLKDSIHINSSNRKMLQHGQEMKKVIRCS